jgi:hypothetical protein
VKWLVERGAGCASACSNGIVSATMLGHRSPPSTLRTTRDPSTAANRQLVTTYLRNLVHLAHPFHWVDFRRLLPRRLRVAAVPRRQQRFDEWRLDRTLTCETYQTYVTYVAGVLIVPGGNDTAVEK